MSKRIDMCFDTLQQRMAKNKIFEIQVEEGKLCLATFNFNSPAKESDIIRYFGANEWYVPEDYLHFLKRHDGADLFTHPDYAGGLRLFSLSLMPDYIREYGYMFPPNCYPIGMLNSAMIYINSDLARDKKNYLFVLAGLYDDK